jgi:hypothetical protein
MRTDLQGVMRMVCAISRVRHNYQVPDMAKTTMRARDTRSSAHISEPGTPEHIHLQHRYGCYKRLQMIDVPIDVD